MIIIIILGTLAGCAIITIPIQQHEALFLNQSSEKPSLLVEEEVRQVNILVWKQAYHHHSSTHIAAAVTATGIFCVHPRFHPTSIGSNLGLAQKFSPMQLLMPSICGGNEGSLTHA